MKADRLVDLKIVQVLMKLHENNVIFSFDLGKYCQKKLGLNLLIINNYFMHKRCLNHKKISKK